MATSLFFVLFLLSIVAFSSSASNTAAGPLIRQACTATRFPSLCITALTAASAGDFPPSPTSLDLTAVAISISARNLTAAQSLVSSILSSSSNNPARSNAASNCVEFLSLSSRRLAAASAAVKSNSNNSNNLADARVWCGAALLYQYDCWSALKYVNKTTQVASAMKYITELTSLTSNALAMVAAYRTYGGDAAKWSPPRTERNGFWESNINNVNEVCTDKTSTTRATGVDGDVTVCKDGSCRFNSVQAAVNAAPANGTERHVVYIKTGVYEETVRVPYEKRNVEFVGDGMGKTVITGKLNADTAGVSTYNTATVGVLGDGFKARDLTFANIAGPDAHQAVAFRSDSDFSILENVEFLGHQDTLYAHGLRQYYRHCRIAGTVDFIFGNSATIFDSCNIIILPRQLNPEKGESNTVAAHGRTDPGQPTGFVFRNCIVNGSDEYYNYYQQKPAKHKCYLGRPWKEYSRTVFINSYLAEIICSEGWLPWKGDFALKTLFYGEFGNSGPGSNATGRVPWSSRIPAAHVGIYSNQNFIQGDRWIPPSPL